MPPALKAEASSRARALRSVAANPYAALYMADPKTFVWNASVESGLENVNHCRAISRVEPQGEDDCES